MTSNTALVTGASSGIGRQLARLLASDGHDLVLVARSEDALVELAENLTDDYGIAATVVVKDLADPESPEEIRDALAERDITVNVLVNNAGFGLYGPFTETDAQRELDMIQVNVTALTHLTKLFLPKMVERGAGRVLNVASTAAFQPGPLMAVYYASKAYVLSFSEAVAEECDGSGVTVTALCPGPTETGFGDRADMTDSKLFQGGVMDAAAVAKAGYGGMQSGERVVVPGVQNRLLAQATRFVPRKTAARFARRAQERAE
ncbi:SDR family NAD(P)-dependent oxidoreductase [Haladaptatus sp. NG-SE-30]